MLFDWTNPYPTIRVPLFARNVVATSHPLAAQAGLGAMLRGGNAVDAIIAAAAMLTIVEPVSCGLGGDAFAILWDGGALHGLNASGIAPAAYTLDHFRKRHGVDGAGHARIPTSGWDSVTTPGVVSAWSALHRRFGALAFEDVLEPAALVAERGVTIAPIVARKWRAALPAFEDKPGFAQTFMPGGRSPETGEKFIFPGAARTLRAIGRTHGETFYRGEIAQAITAFAQETGGALTLQDLDSYEPVWVEPIRKAYRGYDVHEMPPNGQGVAALIALGILDRFDMGELALDSARSMHLQIEAMKLAFADLYAYVADPSAMRVKPAEMLDDAYLAQRASLIDPNRASSPSFGMPRAGGTVYLTAADESGMMVSFIQSNYFGFGSGVVVPSTGVSLQNRGAGFSGDPRSPNVVAPGKRPFHTIIPAFLTKGGAPVMSFGVMGGDMQPQGHLQTLVRMLDYRQQPQAACDAPRWKLNRDFTLDVEDAMAPATVEGLRARGHVLKSLVDPYMDFGSGQFIWRLSSDADHGYVAASDSRRDGCAVGF